jgi:hypothetical protein
MKNTMHVEVKVGGKWHHFTNNYLNVRVNGEMPVFYESNCFIFDTEQEPGIDPDTDKKQGFYITYSIGTYLNNCITKEFLNLEACFTSRQIRKLLASLKETEEAFIKLSELIEDILKAIKCKSIFNIKVDDYRIIFRCNRNT